MKNKKEIASELPDIEQLREELYREQHHRRYHQVLRSTVYALVVVSAAARVDCRFVFTGIADLWEFHGPYLERGQYCHCG